jgi:hypothetical protein
MMKCLVLAMLAGCAVGRGSLPADRDMVPATQRAGIAVTRIFTGPDGQTHAEEITVNVARDDASTELSEMIKSTGVRFRRQAPNYFEDWHTAPRKQYVITLSGRGEIEVSDGRKVAIGPGTILLVEDLTGKGHISRGVGNEERVSAIIPLVE